MTPRKLIGQADARADTLWNAEQSATAIGPLSAEWPNLDISTAYEIQDALLKRRLDAGHTLVGVKLGLTSRAKQQRMGISEPTVSWLTDAMVLPAGVPLEVDRFIHPRAEPEIVFLTGRELCGPGMTAAQALDAVEVILGGIEIIDSRYHGYKFMLPDVIADNSSSGAFILGSVSVKPTDLDLALEAALLEVNGTVIDSATGAAVLGHPAEALAWAVNQLAKRGHNIAAGSIVMTGGMTDAVPVHPGTRICAHFSHLGSITLDAGTTETPRKDIP